MGRYDAANYASKYANIKPRAPQPGVETPKKADDDAGMWRFIGDIAPAAGTALGGIAGGAIGGLAGGGVFSVPGAIGGAGVGASLGGAAGNAIGGLAKNQATEATKPYDEENEKRDEENDRREQRRAEMLSILTSLRR